ncbi:MAG: efflux RND transporter periplasmic adaptor subunit, partial [Pirellulaceae bacterium]
NSTTGIGTILAPRFITVNNELPGTVATVLFEPGQLVEKGVELLSLDTKVEQAQLKAAEVREKFALQAIERNQQMADSIPEKEKEEAESRWEQASAEVEELQAMITRKTITSPFRGRVGLSDVQPGQYLPAGSLITTLHSVEDHLLVEFTLAQYVVNKVNTGDSVIVVFGDTNYPAKISAIDAQADRQTRNMRVRARVDNPPDSLRPGDSVSVKVEYGTAMNLMSVPAQAVRRSPQETFVFLAETNKAGELRATARPVLLATVVGSNIGIASGLSADDQVIVEGSFKLQDGTLITFAQPEPEGEPASDQ